MDDKGPEKSPEAFRTISEAAASLDLPQHVLRFWETRFPQIKPLKRGGGRRYYRPDDVELLRAIRRLLYDEGYTIKGVQKMLREQGVSAIAEAPPEPPPAFRAPRAEPVAQVRIEPSLGEAEPPRTAAPSPPRQPPPGPRLNPDDVSALRGALADLREAERILAQVRPA
jgi:DNA-binding transcriptional MerR regulator